MKIFCLLLGLFVSFAFALTYHGSDLSSLAIVEKNGVSFSDNGNKAPFETILRNHGSNAARIRIWTAGDYSLDYGLALAKRVKAAGMTLVVDLHFSDTCMMSPFVLPLFTDSVGCLALGADPGKQGIPSSWPKDLNGLNTQIYTSVMSI